MPRSINVILIKLLSIFGCHIKLVRLISGESVVYTVLKLRIPTRFRNHRQEGIWDLHTISLKPVSFHRSVHLGYSLRRLGIWNNCVFVIAILIISFFVFDSYFVVIDPIFIVDHSVNHEPPFAPLVIFNALSEFDLLAHINVMVIVVKQPLLLLEYFSPLQILLHPHWVIVLIELVIVIESIFAALSMEMILNWPGEIIHLVQLLCGYLIQRKLQFWRSAFETWLLSCFAILYGGTLRGSFSFF